MHQKIKLEIAFSPVKHLMNLQKTDPKIIGIDQMKLELVPL